MKIFFAGQQTLANRGCEALVVSTLEMLTEARPDTTFIIPSTDIARDSAAMSKYGFNNYTFVPAPEITPAIRVWNRLMRYFPALASVWVPEKMHWDAETLEQLLSSDRVLHIGGDTYSYDYSYAGLISNTAQIERIARMGKHQEIWCATVGPFDSCPQLERRVLDKFRKLNRITVREIESRDYLVSNGVPAVLVADPAFNLKPQANDLYVPKPGQKRIVVNISPYIYRKTTAEAVEPALQTFVKKRIGEGYRIVLVSHVNTATSSDTAVIRNVFQDILDNENVDFVPEELTAAQFKGVVAGADFVVASRTHVTIAGFSSATPVLSIAYSAKAPRLNRFLFGHEAFLINAWDITTDDLEKTFQQVAGAQDEIRATLSEKGAALRATFRSLCESVFKE
ncbi:polysaccharide pyruvyl transferase family protein [Martelella mediterranea]|uniref:Colanic acid biosynthesis protein n=1 Tax=Martelella mediterranea DSM 17316 TaxID=1122214 RepID=A0A1U9Z020_9HYPH|nr:polysaccharide pyruvyl transferase family protein [Martelella mediterranea]AQZ51041.1 colanic acid biosynthesis protein [Martelella mediterranea DSM 17316]